MLVEQTGWDHEEDPACLAKEFTLYYMSNGGKFIQSDEPIKFYVRNEHLRRGVGSEKEQGMTRSMKINCNVPGKK